MQLIACIAAHVNGGSATAGTAACNTLRHTAGGLTRMTVLKMATSSLQGRAWTAEVIGAWYKRAGTACSNVKQHGNVRSAIMTCQSMAPWLHIQQRTPCNTRSKVPLESVAHPPLELHVMNGSDVTTPLRRRVHGAGHVCQAMPTMSASGCHTPREALSGAVARHRTCICN